MTSFQRQDDAYYGGHRWPEYGVISYTWGRFQVSDGPRIKINGISWPIPAIDPNHYTVEALKAVLARVQSDGFEYVWIDIACIDQANPSIKAEEIGRQAGIFQRASGSYVWLNRSDPQAIQEHIQTLVQYKLDIELGQIDVGEIANDVEGSIVGILQEPWFTSMWTLQESFLRPEALLLNKNGDFINIRNPESSLYDSDKNLSRASLKDITSSSTIANKFAKASLEDSLNPSLENLDQLIDRFGIDYGEYGEAKNPNVLYSAARFCQTKHPEDRIYSIMQAYGFCLGKAKERTQDFSLEELEVQFLQQLANTSSVLSQSFVHASAPDEGSEWSIINHIHIPMIIRESLLNPVRCPSTCKIDIWDKRSARFDGFGWKLQQLLDFWLAKNEETIQTLPEYHGDLDRYIDESRQGILLDATETISSILSFMWPSHEYKQQILNCEKQGEYGSLVWDPSDEFKRTKDRKLQNYGRQIMKEYNEADVFALHLGNCEREAVSERFQSFHCPMNIALLIGKARSKWRRIGLCFWYGRQRPSGHDRIEYSTAGRGTVAWAGMPLETSDYE